MDYQRFNDFNKYIYIRLAATLSFTRVIFDPVRISG